ncbi:shikimate dehydrogenase [Marinitoga sp. 1137]|uniref:shikimate dehydrogenase family protein n=1 Tax=unclassified Marinitoga TaxID=2640159 RepID=UPI0009F8B66F|nr:shikimate dehydrogenase [Marinitoga sp. 1137]
MNKIKLGILQFPHKITLSEKVYTEYFKFLNSDSSYNSITINPELFDFEIEKILNSYDGLNVTVPFKEKIMKYIDVIEDASVLKAINNIYNKIGYNTDWIGFINSLKESNYNLNGKILIFGAGGVARAIVYGLYKLGIDKVTVINRTYERALNLKVEFQKIINIIPYPLEKLNNELKDTSIFINASSLGMFNEKLPIEPSYLKNIKLVYDVVYYNTPLQELAKELNINLITGEKMWYYQAIENLKIWNIYDESKFKKAFQNFKK